MDRDANRLLRVHTRTGAKFALAGDLVEARRFLARAEHYITPGVVAFTDGGNTVFSAYSQRVDVEFRSGDGAAALAYADKAVSLASAPAPQEAGKSALPKDGKKSPRGRSFHDFLSTQGLLYRCAVECAGRGDHADALGWARRAIALTDLADPADAAVAQRQARNHRLLCVSASEGGDLPSAMTAVNRAHALSPCSESLYLRLRVQALVEAAGTAEHRAAAPSALAGLLPSALQHPDFSLDMSLSLLSFLSASHPDLLPDAFAQLRRRFPALGPRVDAAEAYCAVTRGSLAQARLAVARLDDPSESLVLALWAATMRAYDEGRAAESLQWGACLVRAAKDMHTEARALLACSRWC
jgi:hypothetical protein